MQSLSGPGSASSGIDREIVAFHPGAAGRPVPSEEGPFHPLEGWKDSQYNKPDPGVTVTGWTGRFMCKCVYDHSRSIWVTNKGTPIKVVIWKKQQ